MDKPLKVRIKANIQCDAVYSSTVLGSVPFTVSAIPSKSIDYYKINIEYVNFFTILFISMLFWEVQGNRRTRKEPTWTQKVHVKLHLGGNLSSGSNRRRGGGAPYRITAMSQINFSPYSKDIQCRF